MIPDNLPRLSSGKQNPNSGAVCAEQAVSWLVSGRLDLGDETDHPECVQPVLNALAIHVNDSVSDEDRQRMWPLILRQPSTARPEMEPMLSVKMAAWCAEQVLDLVRPGDWQVCRDAITAAQVWAENPSKENAAYAANAANAAANAAADAAYAANAANAAANAAAYAANAANAANAAYAAYAAHIAAAAYAAANAAANAAAYAAYAAAYAAANAAANAAHIAAANAAYAAANAAAGDMIDFLSRAQDECERLIGVDNSCRVDIERVERLGELVGCS